MSGGVLSFPLLLLLMYSMKVFKLVDNWNHMFYELDNFHGSVEMGRKCRLLSNEFK